jgi:arginase
VESMTVCIIQVPYVLGDERQGASKGPGRLVEAGADKVVASKGIAVKVEHVDRGGPFRDSGNASLTVCKQLAEVVRKTVQAGAFPLILSGGCDVSKGILSGFDHSQCGIVWFDAHGDFNTPETTVSGYLDGMSLAILTGHCYRSYWAEIGNSAPVADSSTLLLGVRDLDRAEEELLTRSKVQLVKWREGTPQSDMRVALDTLRQSVAEVYLHIDIDSMDPKFAPGVMLDPVPGGISLDDMEAAIRGVFDRFRVRAAALTVYDPDRDQDDRTLKTGLRLIELVADRATAQCSRF